MVSVISVANIEMIPAPHPFFVSPAAPSLLHSSQVPVPICSARPYGVGAGRRFHIISTVNECEVGMGAWVKSVGEPLLF